jgi:hypothetical protein
MNSVSEQLIAEIESLFGQLRENSFDRKVASAIPYEVQKDNEQINPEGFIAPGAVSDLDIFTSTIRPVAVVAVLPVLPNDDYPEGSTVVLTTTGVLYRNYGGSWTANVTAAGGGIEIVGALPALPDTDYPSGSVVFLTTDDKLYRNDDGSWSKAVDGGDITASTVTADAILAGTITGAKIAASTIEADNLAADSITAGKIAAGAVSAEKLAATIVLASLFKTADSGNRVEFNSQGIRLYSASEVLLVNIPTDGSAVYVAADIVASNLIVDGSALFRGDDNAIAPEKELILQSSIAAPSAAPTVWGDRDYFILETSSPLTGDINGMYYDAAGGAGGVTASVVGVAEDIANDLWKVLEFDLADGSLDRTTTLGTVLPSAYQLWYITRLGASWYTTSYKAGDSTFWIHKFARATGTLEDSEDITSDFLAWGGLPTVPPIATDGSSLFVAGKGTSTKPKVVAYDTSLNVGASVTIDDSDGHGHNIHPNALLVQDAGDGNGSLFWVGRYETGTDEPGFTVESESYMEGYNKTTGAAVALTKFWAGEILGGSIVHDGTQFLSVGNGGDSPAVFYHTNWLLTGTGAAQYTFWVGYSWYDSAGTTHETVVGPTTDFTHYSRRRFTVTVPALPGAGGADEPNNVRVYMVPSATLPADSSLDLQATGTGPTIHITTYDSGGAAPNGGTAFAATTRANIHADDDSIWINAQDDGPYATGYALEADDAYIDTLDTGSLASGTFSTAVLSLWGPGPALHDITYGTSMPVSPDTGDMIFRSDLYMWFVYDGSRWISTTLYHMPLSLSFGDSGGVSASQAQYHSGVVPYHPGSAILIEDIHLQYYVSAGTALSGSHKWVVTFYTKSGNYTVSDTLGSYSIDSGSSSTWRSQVITVDATPGTDNIITMDVVKTGTPGALRSVALVTYRVVAA